MSDDERELALALIRAALAKALRELDDPDARISDDIMALLDAPPPTPTLH